MELPSKLVDLMRQSDAGASLDALVAGLRECLAVEGVTLTPFSVWWDERDWGEWSFLEEILLSEGGTFQIRRASTRFAGDSRPGHLRPLADQQVLGHRDLDLIRRNIVAGIGANLKYLGVPIGT